MQRLAIRGVDTLIKDIPSSNSVTLSLFLDVGLPLELDDEVGMSHFLEHMCFRGTKRRTSYEITKEIDSLGGIINAYTTKEFTCYYITVLPEYINEALDILVDIVFFSTHVTESIELEKSIITEEINMYEDTPDDKIIDLLNFQLFKGFHLGKPILGTVDSISKFNPKKLKRYYENYFYKDNIKLVVAGAIGSLDTVTNTIKSNFDVIPFASSSKLEKDCLLPQYESSIKNVTKDLEQMHLCYGFPGLEYNSDDRYALTLLTTLMGGSMSSRLFQSVRERAGLAYSIYCSASFYRQAGGVIIYAGTSNDNFLKAQECIDSELQLLKKGISDDEFDRTLRQLKGNIMIHLEGSSAWANWLGRQLIYNSGLTTMDELQSRLNSITKRNVVDLIDSIFLGDIKVNVSLGSHS
ncbi:MAG: pitrilysin family protein [Candidatus Margulisiibacteriota bacterium]|nr:pitrilysin family protein [Candidatus Margulisiibacteriota bacterium]